MKIERLYLDTLKVSLTEYYSYSYPYYAPVKNDLASEFNKVLEQNNLIGYRLCEEKQYRPELREEGRDWPEKGETMVGLKRLNNLEELVKRIQQDNIPGDLFEAGVWRGGSSIFMAALNNVYLNNQRSIWLADSFQGLPPSTMEQDKSFDFTIFDELAVSLEQVKSNFERYSLLNENVRFLKGWFSETLPDAEVDRIALLRMDGDLYESTMDILNNLYHKVVPGGFIVVDDYSLQCCKDAIADFRNEHNISDEMVTIDWTGMYWRKS